MFSNKLLVLIDGRSIYGLEFGGVHWEMQMIPLDTIEQIELIRGPGGSLWGASAVNGVINIITKRADESQGGQVSTLVSNYEPGTVAVRYGSRFGTSVSNVTGVRYFQRASPVAVAGYPDSDATQVFQARTRLDWGQQGQDRFSLNADLQQGSSARISTVPSLLLPYQSQSLDSGHFTAGSATLAWTRNHSASSESSVQASYTAYTRADAVFPQRWHVASLDARHRLALGARARRGPRLRLPPLV